MMDGERRTRISCPGASAQANRCDTPQARGQSWVSDYAYFGSIRTVSGSNRGPGRMAGSTVTVIRQSSTARRRSCRARSGSRSQPYGGMGPS